MPDDQKKKCFFISPIGADGSEQRTLADKVLKHIVRKGLGDEFEVERGDEPQNPGSITPQIIASVLNADLIVADLTGANPNVFYEVAIAHGFRKPTVHIQKKGEKKEFDVKDMRIVSYDLDPDDVETAQKTLLKFAQFALSTPDKIETPLTSAQEFTAVRSSTDPVAESNVLVMDSIALLSRDVRRVLRQVQGRPRLLNSDPEEDENRKSLTKFVSKVVKSNEAQSQWFDSMITPGTSEAFDNWVKRRFVEATGIQDDDEIRDVLWSQEMFDQHITIDEDFDVVEAEAVEEGDH